MLIEVYCVLCSPPLLSLESTLPFPWFTPPRGRVRKPRISTAALCRKKADGKGLLAENCCLVIHKHGKSLSLFCEEYLMKNHIYNKSVTYLLC